MNEVKQVETDKLSDFFKVAQRVYEGDRNWIPEMPLFVKKRLESLDRSQFSIFVAYHDSVPVARCIAALSPKKGAGFIGMFECVSGMEDAGRLLLGAAEHYLRGEDVLWVTAPQSDNMVVGLQVDHFDVPPTVGTPYNPPYYLDIFLNHGYKISKRTMTYWLDQSVFNFPFVKPPSGITIREFERENLDREVRIFNELNRLAFADFPHYSPRTIEEELQYVKSFLPFLNDDLVLIAETDTGDPVGFFICLPDMYQQLRGEEITQVRAVSIAVHPKFQGTGVGLALVSRMIQNVKDKTSYVRAEVSWIYEDNSAPLKLVNRYGASPGRTFAILEKRL